MNSTSTFFDLTRFFSDYAQHNRQFTTADASRLIYKPTFASEYDFDTSVITLQYRINFLQLIQVFYASDFVRRLSLQPLLCQINQRSV